MDIFGPADAQHYCGSYGGAAGMATGSLKAYYASHLRNVTTIVEGTPGFAAYRDCALRDVERSVFLAISHYRRFADMMSCSSAPWAFVTLYYGAYYAASAVLGMFGGWVNNRTTIDVAVNAPGHQVLRVTRKIKSINQGSHKIFWECFYGAVTSLYPWVDPALVIALQPVAGSVTWQIDTRNLINYDSFASHQFMSQFHAGFKREGFPGGLPGVLNTEYQIFEGLVRIACSFLKEFGLVTDALAGLPFVGPRRAKIRGLVFDVKIPRLGGKLRRRPVLSRYLGMEGLRRSARSAECILDLP